LFLGWLGDGGRGIWCRRGVMDGQRSLRGDGINRHEMAINKTRGCNKTPVEYFRVAVAVAHHETSWASAVYWRWGRWGRLTLAGFQTFNNHGELFGFRGNDLADMNNSCRLPTLTTLVSFFNSAHYLSQAFIPGFG
jgi:hypothetical protein